MGVKNLKCFIIPTFPNYRTIILLARPLFFIDKKPMPSDLKKVKAGPVYPEDSSNEEDTDHDGPPAKKVNRCSCR